MHRRVARDPHAPRPAAPPARADGRARLYLRRYWQLRVPGRRAGPSARARRRGAVDEARGARAGSTACFPTVARAVGAGLAEDRLRDRAPRALDRSSPAGRAPARRYTAARLLALLLAMATDGQPSRIALAAPTGKAAARLKQSIDDALDDLQQRSATLRCWPICAGTIGAARTLHALLGTRPGTRRFRHDAANPLDVDVLVVDEASMVHVEMMAALLDALPRARAPAAARRQGPARIGRGRRGARRAVPRCRARALHAETARFVDATLTRSARARRRRRRVGSAARAADRDAARSQRFARPDRRRSRRPSTPATRDRGDGCCCRKSAAARSAWRCRRRRRARSSSSRSRPAAALAGGYRTLPGRDARPARGVVRADRSTHGPGDVLAAFDRFRVLCAVRDGDVGRRRDSTARSRARCARRPARRQAAGVVRRAAGDGHAQRPGPRRLQRRHRHRAAGSAADATALAGLLRGRRGGALGGGQPPRRTWRRPSR